MPKSLDLRLLRPRLASLGVLPRAGDSGVIYVAAGAPAGGDGTFFAPLTTFGAAIAAASALSPEANNRITIRCEDNGAYDENISVPAYVDVDAPGATLQSAANATTLTLAENTRAHFREVIQDQGGTSAVLKNATAGTALFKADRVTLDSGTGAVGNLGAATNVVLIADVRQVWVNADNGIGIGDVSNIGHMHVSCGDIYLNADGAVGVLRGGTGTTVGRVDHILELGTRTGTVAFQATAGSLLINSNQISVDTAANISAGAELQCFANSVSGVESGAGTINITVPS